MAKVYKIAGQSAPLANTNTDLYTVPASTTFVGSTLIIANRSVDTVATAFRVAVVPSGQTLSDKHYIEYDKLIDSRESIKLTLGWALSTGDKVIVRASSASLSFTLFGVENT